MFGLGFEMYNYNNKQKTTKMIHYTPTIIVIIHVKDQLLTRMKSKLLEQNLQVITNFLLFEYKLLFHVQVSNL